MRDAYTSLDESDRVFRHVTRGGGYFPGGQQLPLPGWLQPNKQDREEATRTGRRPGVSAWDLELTTFEGSWEIRDRETVERGGSVVAEEARAAFCGRVGDIRSIAASVPCDVDVVRDPLDPKYDPHGQGHVLIEGMQRLPEVAKKDHEAFLMRVTRVFTQIRPANG